MGGAIFISYRRDDSEGEAGRLFDDLTRAFGQDCVFLDVAGIHPGMDFRKAIEDHVSSCGVLLAMIGPSWTNITNSSGQRRLDDPNDFVRIEVAAALARNIPVIPVLVHEARVPRPEQLPDNLKDLAWRNSVEITHARWNSDVQLLTQALQSYVTTPPDSALTDNQPVHANVPVQLPPPHPSPQTVAPVKKSSRMPLIAGISAVVVLLAVATVLLVLRSSAKSAASSSPAVGHSASPDPLNGTWTNPVTLQRNGLAQVAISGTGNQLSMRAWGQCRPANCDWGAQQARFESGKATATWTFLNDSAGQEKGRVATVTVAPDGDRLKVNIVNTFPGRRGTQREFEFTRASGQ